MTKVVSGNRDGADQSNVDAASDDAKERQDAELDLGGGDRSMDPESMTVTDVIEAENSRPDLPDENADGLDELEEAVRRNAEDVPLDVAGRD